MHPRHLAVLTALALPIAAFPQTAPPPTNILNPDGSNLEDAFQTNYVSHLDVGDGVVNVTNAGSSAGNVAPVIGSNTSGNICVNAYVYQSNETLLACCSCGTTPNGLYAWSFIVGSSALLAHVTPKPASVLVKLLATSPGAGSTPTNTICDPTFLNAPFTLVPGMAAWSTHTHPTNTAGIINITETEFGDTGLTTGEAVKLETDCANLGAAKQCPTCSSGGLAVPASEASLSLSIKGGSSGS